MTATEELRRLLDERGVKWVPIAWNPKRETFYHAENGVGFCADEYTDGVKIYTDATITPEQAIAATLGDSEYESKMDELLCRLTNGKWSKTREYPIDFMESVVCEQFEDDYNTGLGTCHTVSMDCFGNPPYNQSGLNGNSIACGCSECGAPWSVMGIFRGNALRHNFKACPICGRKVVEPTTNDVDAEVDA